MPDFPFKITLEGTISAVDFDRASLYYKMAFAAYEGVLSSVCAHVEATTQEFTPDGTGSTFPVQHKITVRQMEDGVWRASCVVAEPPLNVSGGSPDVAYYAAHAILRQQGNIKLQDTTTAEIITIKGVIE